MIHKFEILLSYKEADMMHKSTFYYMVLMLIKHKEISKIK